jgi:hypothetical protein
LTFSEVRKVWHGNADSLIRGLIYPKQTTMPESTDPASTPAPETATPTHSRGYFNQSQLEDLDLAESVLAAARDHSAEMQEQDITATWLDDFQAATAEARSRASSAGHSGAQSKQATAAAIQAAADLHTALRKIQSAAKQKHQMLAADGDPATHFPTDGYLIGSRLNGSRAHLLQSAATLITRAKADDLPGFKTPEKIAAVEALLTAYSATEDGQAVSSRDKELARLDRDGLLHNINSRRLTIQHAADALWPPTDEATRPIRKSFSLPPSRSLGF